MMNGLLSNSVLSWRLVGSAVWHAAISAVLCITYDCIWNPVAVLSPTGALASLFSFYNWINISGLLWALAPATAAHAASITTEEPASKNLPGLQYAPAWLAATLRRAVARAATPQAAALSLVSFAAHTVSAALFLYQATGPSKSLLSLYQFVWAAAILALVYQLHVIYWSRDVLTFPTIQRHRYFRIKQQLPSLIPPALTLATVSCLATSAASWLAGHGALNATAAVPLWGAAVLCVLCWLAGTVVLEVVFTERLRPDDYDARDCLATMALCLSGSRGKIIRDLTLHDLSLLPTDPGKGAWRREEVFADDSGARWRPLGQPCVAAVAEVAVAMAGALPQRGEVAVATGGGKGGSRYSSSAAKWNAVPYVLVKGVPLAQQRNLNALEALCRGYQRCKLASRALCNFAVVSLTADRFGVLQMGSPGLGDGVMCMLSTLIACQTFSKQAGGAGGAALGPWRAAGDAPYFTREAAAAVHALADELTTGMYQVVAAFGPALKEALGKATEAPAYGSKADAAALLERFLSGEQ